MYLLDLYNVLSFSNNNVKYSSLQKTTNLELYNFQPIIPIFTENLREAFRTVSFGRRLFLKIYAYFKMPMAPIYGGFPVKLITHVGEPIEYDPDLTPEQLQAKVSKMLVHICSCHL